MLLEPVAPIMKCPRRAVDRMIELGSAPCYPTCAISYPNTRMTTAVATVSGLILVTAAE
jgi:hypothetical protein